jgi:hypothetical protein
MGTGNDTHSDAEKGEHTPPPARERFYGVEAKVRRLGDRHGRYEGALHDRRFVAASRLEGLRDHDECPSSGPSRRGRCLEDGPVARD